MHIVDQNSATAGHWGVNTFLIDGADVLDCRSPHEAILFHVHCVSNLDSPGAGMACERPFFSTKRRWSSVIFKLLFFVVVMLRNSCNFSCSR